MTTGGGNAEQDGEPAEADRVEDDATATRNDPSATNDAPAGSSGTFAPMPIAGGAGQADQQAPPPDPARTLGDANEAWRKRLDAIDTATETERDPQATAERNDANDVEHVRDDEAAESQALGPASEEQSREAALRDVDGEVDPDAPMDEEPTMDVDVEERVQAPVQVDMSRPTEADVSAFSSAAPRDLQAQRTMDVDLMDEDRSATDAHDIQTDEPESSSRVEEELVRWRAGDESALEPEAVWRLYTSLTRGACNRLTEQLRLVLEPTQATRLRGDYRSGKRLNMKRLIPYIASDFTKDKIWLRRTRPSAREYQILLALDDSKSMADSHAVHLAFQALAVVSGALGRLEAGDISVCRFGAEVDVVHPFGSGSALLDDAAGADIVRRFTFAQRKTDLVRLLETSLAQLGDARAQKRGGSTELWQLMIIISDGLCQDQDRLRALLRKAYETRVIVVFVVVDSLHSRPPPSSAATSSAPPPTGDSSILSMKSVSYAQSADGKLEMRVERYMDTFPFEYYVVLRDADALPDILSQTLRQFFERVRSLGVLI
jgi:midasin